jgi:hypothetical protein
MPAIIGPRYDEDLAKDTVFLIEHAKHLPKVSGAAKNFPLPTIKEVATKVAIELKLEPEDVERLLNTLANILRFQAKMRLDRNELFELFTSNLNEYASVGKNKEILKKWESARELIVQSLGEIGPDHPLSLMRKAERLFFRHERILGEANIITDLRPVFDRSGEKIVRFMVTHALFLEYNDAGTHKRLELGVDTGDLALIRSACERAQVKAITLREAMKDKPWPTTLGLDED